MKKLLGLMILAISIGTNAQDLHFTQYFNSPLLVNPANTGFIPDNDYRLGANYRTQWATITHPYKTMSIWGDVQLFADRFENGWMGIGGAVLKDVAGSGNLSATRAFGSIAYHQMVGLNSLVSAGFNIGYINKSIDFTKLTFDNQWNGKFFDIAAPAGESFTTNNVSYFDLQAGLNYALFPSDNAYLNIGFSAMHLNRPSETFFANSGADARVSPRYTLFANALIKLNDRWILAPNAYVSKMSTAMEYVAGGVAHYNLSGDGSTQLIGGAYYRIGDAVAPTLGFQLNDYKLTFSYDATVSSLGKYNGTRGAYEVSLVKTGVFGGGTREVRCNVPSF